MYEATFKDLDICQRMIPLRKLHLNDLYLLFQSKQNWNFNISETVRASATCEMTLSTSRCSKILVFYSKMNAKLFLQICLHLYGACRRVALVAYALSEREKSWKHFQLYIEGFSVSGFLRWKSMRGDVRRRKAVVWVQAVLVNSALYHSEKPTTPVSPAESTTIQKLAPRPVAAQPWWMSTDNAFYHQNTMQWTRRDRVNGEKGIDEDGKEVVKRGMRLRSYRRCTY